MQGLCTEQAIRGHPPMMGCLPHLEPLRREDHEPRMNSAGGRCREIVTAGHFAPVYLDNSGLLVCPYRAFHS